MTLVKTKETEQTLSMKPSDEFISTMKDYLVSVKEDS